MKQHPKRKALAAILRTQHNWRSHYAKKTARTLPPAALALPLALLVKLALWKGASTSPHNPAPIVHTPPAPVPPGFRFVPKHLAKINTAFAFDDVMLFIWPNADWTTCRTTMIENKHLCLRIGSPIEIANRQTS